MSMFEPVSSSECENSPKFLGVVVLLDENEISRNLCFMLGRNIL